MPAETPQSQPDVQKEQRTGAPDVGFENDTLPSGPASTSTLQPDTTAVERVGTENDTEALAGHACVGKGVGAGSGDADADVQYELAQLAGHVTAKAPWPAR